jgi:hypothetical protein
MKEDILDLLERNTEKGQVFAEAYDLYEHLDDDGSIHEIIDSHIGLYCYDLRKWAVDNYGYIEEALEEGLAEGVTDFHKLIQCGQYVQLTEQAHRYIEELYEELDGKLFNIELEEEPEEEPVKYETVLLEGAEREAYIKARFNI